MCVQLLDASIKKRTQKQKKNRSRSQIECDGESVKNKESDENVRPAIGCEHNGERESRETFQNKRVCTIHPSQTEKSHASEEQVDTALDLQYSTKKTLLSRFFLKKK